MRHGVRLLPLLLILALAPPCLSRTWYITPDGSGDAPTIQAGIDSSAAGDTLQLATGIFMESGIYLDRDIVLRGDCDKPTSVVIDGQNTDRIMACRTATAIEGLTFTRGYANWQSWDQPVGGGIYCRGNVGSISFCLFEDNEAFSSGGGILVHTSPTAIHDCIFRGNKGAHGGGVALLGGTTEMRDCLFHGNMARYTGGAVRIRENNASVVRCMCTQNVALESGGAVEVHRASPTIDHGVFLDNEARYGGAIYVYFGTPTIEHGFFSGNVAERGGAITFDKAWMANVKRCTVVGNRADEGGGLALVAGTGNVPVIESTVIAYQGSGGSVRTVDPMDPGIFVLRCCNIYGNVGGDWVPGILHQLGQDGNLSVDPLFCDMDNGDYTLAANSPCLPGNHPAGWDCGLIGALGQGCGPISRTLETWARIKARYR